MGGNRPDDGRAGGDPVSRRLRAAVIGLGVGERHADAYRDHPDCELVALCDREAPVLEQVRPRFPGLHFTTEPDDILDDPGIDLVSIASWDDQHARQVVRALVHGKHVLVEKPLCLHREEAIEIRRALALAPGLRLSSNLVLRCVPRFQWLREEIGCGRFGELFYVEGDYQYGRIHKLTDGWRGRLPYYSVLLGGAVHLVDLLLWLTGDRVIEVDAFGNRIATQGTAFRYFDLVAGLLRFASGMVGKVTANMGCVHPHFHGLDLYGTRATFHNGTPHGTLLERHHGVPAPVPVEAAYPGARQSELARDFVSALVQERDPLVTEEEVFAAFSVCLALETAATGGGRVTVDYL